MARFCGGLKLGNTLEIVNGIITVSGEMPDITHTISPCGMLFDGEEFEVMDYQGAHMLTSIGRDEEMEAVHPIKTNCGFYVDPLYFTFDDNGALEFDDAHIAEVLVEPIDATVVVTYGDADTPVEPIPGTTNMYKLMEIEQTYTVAASKEGYTTASQDIDATENHIVEISLQVAQD